MKGAGSHPTGTPGGHLQKMAIGRGRWVPVEDESKAMHRFWSGIQALETYRLPLSDTYLSAFENSRQTESLLRLPAVS